MIKPKDYPINYNPKLYYIFGNIILYTFWAKLLIFRSNYFRTFCSIHSFLHFLPNFTIESRFYLNLKVILTDVNEIVCIKHLKVSLSYGIYFTQGDQIFIDCYIWAMIAVMRKTNKIFLGIYLSIWKFYPFG